MSELADMNKIACGIACPDRDGELIGMLNEHMRNKQALAASRNIFSLLRAAAGYLRSEARMNEVYEQCVLRAVDCQGPVLEDPNDPYASSLICGLTAREQIAKHFEEGTN